MLLAQCSPAESGPESIVVATTTTTTTTTTFVVPDASTTSTQVVSSTSVAVTTSTTDPGPDDIYLEPTVGGVGVESCRLLDQSADTRYRYHLSTGFPVETANFEPEGSFKIALIPLEFDDFRGNASDIDDAVEHSEMVSDWYSMVSNGRVSIDWQVHDSFIKVPHNLQDFALERSRSDDNRLARVAFEAADPLVDFTDVRAAVFLLPRAQQWMTEGVQGFLHSNFGYEGGFKSDEGSIYNYAIGGAYWQRPHKEIWSYWAHEMGHMFPLPDLYDVRGQWWNGVDLEIPGGPFSQFDMMANQDGPSRTLSTWLRFMMGWLDDAQVLCLDPTSAPNGEVALVHTDAYEPGIKSVMIPLDSTRIIVIESRRPNEKFDCAAPGWRGRTGVLVFTADMTIGHGNAFQHLVVPGEPTLYDASNCGVPPQLDAILVPGDTVTIDNVTISVIESGNYDHIKIATT